MRFLKSKFLWFGLWAALALPAALPQSQTPPADPPAPAEISPQPSSQNPLSEATAPNAVSGGWATQQFREIRQVRLDPEQCYRVRDLFLEREDVKLYLTDGYLLFSETFQGRTIAAAFVATEPSDEGEVLLIPPSERERASLARFTNQPVLSEKFRTAMMFFTDDTADVLRRELAANPYNSLDLEAGKRLAPDWTPIFRNIFGTLSLRTLIDLGSSPDNQTGYFAASIAGGRLGRFDITIDPYLPQDVQVGQLAWRDGRGYLETWCQFPGRSARESRRPAPAEPGFLDDFSIETNLASDLSMEVIAKATLVLDEYPSQIVPFELSRRFRLTEVLVDEAPVEFLQFDEFGATGAPSNPSDLVAIVLPAPSETKSRYSLEFRYRGTVISEAGGQVYYVGSRGSWYPRRGSRFTDFELLFHYPDTFDLVATGDEVESSTDAGVRTTRFRTSSPIQLAGFNLGRYQRVSKQVGPYTVEVCANLGVESNLQPRWQPEPVLIVPSSRTGRRRMPEPVLIDPPQPEPPSPAARLDSVANHSARAVEFFSARLGPPSVSHIVISPIPGGFGQGFPGLVYASTLSYFDPTDTPLQKYSASQRLFFSELLRTHEIAHQWWGNVVTAASAADSWLMEALATYSALLFLEDNLDKQALDRVLEEYRDHLLEENEIGQAVDEAGAIVLGERLRSSRLPRADRIIVYEKGAWIMHMLRSAMGDESFFAFLKRICESYRFKPITTEEFQREAVQFLPEGFPDPTLEIFFDQWVYGTGIPSLRLSHNVNGRSSRFNLTARLVQQDVPESFATLVPVEIHTLPGRSLVKWIVTEGRQTEFSVVLQNKPTRVEINPGNSILLRPQR